MYPDSEGLIHQFLLSIAPSYLYRVSTGLLELMTRDVAPVPHALLDQAIQREKSCREVHGAHAVGLRNVLAVFKLCGVRPHSMAYVAALVGSFHAP